MWALQENSGTTVNPATCVHCYCIATTAEHVYRCCRCGKTANFMSSQQSRS